MDITISMLHHQGLHMAPSSPALRPPTASKWATDTEKTVCSVLKAHSVQRAPPNLHPALRKQALCFEEDDDVEKDLLFGVK